MKAGKVIVRMCTGRRRQILSILHVLNIPHQACRGKLEDNEILCFQLNIPVSRGNLEDKSVCMGNEGST
jgi:hypothetical protein